MNKKLKEIGEKLEVREGDIKEIKRGKIRDWIFDNLVSFILSILLVFTTSYLVISIIEDQNSTQTYPYTAVSIMPLMIKKKSGVSPVVALVLMLIISTILIFTLYSMVPAYGVYSKKWDGEHDVL